MVAEERRLDLQWRYAGVTSAVIPRRRKKPPFRAELSANPGAAKRDPVGGARRPTCTVQLQHTALAGAYSVRRDPRCAEQGYSRC